MRHDVERFLKPYRINDGKGFKLQDHDPRDTGPVKDKEQAAEALEKAVAWLSETQEKLYAQDRWSLLLIFQAMDAAGKDGTIKHVMSGINPQGCQIYSFKAPSSEDLDHDFMWRCMKCLPERGRIGIFNRSYYEEVLIVKVHQELLKAQRLDPSLVTKNIWDERYEDIRNIERYLTRNGVIIRKFFLNVSKDEQRDRLIKRLDDPAKNWKFSHTDVHEREHWDDYMDAYQEMIRQTSTPWAPWYVIPADKKWFTRLAVSAAVIDALDDLDLSFPAPDPSKLAEFEEVEKHLRSQ